MATGSALEVVATRPGATVGATPRHAVALVFVVLLAALALEASHDLLGLAPGDSKLFDSYIYDTIIGASAVLMIVRGLLASHERAWLLMGMGTLLWLGGDIVWDITYGAGGTGVHPLSLSDGLWLPWYLFAAVALVMLVRSRLHDFDLGRWIDGIALALVVATPGVALVLQPAILASHLPFLDHAVAVAYPTCDILLLGATLGVIALAGWRPGRSWYTLSVGLSIWVIADALYSVQELRGTYVSGVYDFLWPAGMLVVAYAAWEPWAPRRATRPTGWQAIALPLACQAIALGTQVVGLVWTLGESERVMSIAVLAVVIVQLYVSRSAPPQVTGEFTADEAEVTTPPVPSVVSSSLRASGVQS